MKYLKKILIPVLIIFMTFVIWTNVSSLGCTNDNDCNDICIDSVCHVTKTIVTNSYGAFSKVFCAEINGGSDSFCYTYTGTMMRYEAATKTYNYCADENCDHYAKNNGEAYSLSSDKAKLYNDAYKKKIQAAQSADEKTKTNEQTKESTKKNLGSECGDNSECASGECSIGFGNACVAYKLGNQIKGQICTSHIDCVTSFCNAGKCDTRPKDIEKIDEIKKNGEACGNDNYICASGNCVNGKCAEEADEEWDDIYGSESDGMPATGSKVSGTVPPAKGCKSTYTITSTSGNSVGGCVSGSNPDGGPPKFFLSDNGNLYYYNSEKGMYMQCDGAVKSENDAKSKCTIPTNLRDGKNNKKSSDTDDDSVAQSANNLRDWQTDKTKCGQDLAHGIGWNVFDCEATKCPDGFSGCYKRKGYNSEGDCIKSDQFKCEKIDGQWQRVTANCLKKGDNSCPEAKTQTEIRTCLATAKSDAAKKVCSEIKVQTDFFLLGSFLGKRYKGIDYDEALAEYTQQISDSFLSGWISGGLTQGILRASCDRQEMSDESLSGGLALSRTSRTYLHVEGEKSTLTKTIAGEKSYQYKFTFDIDPSECGIVFSIVLRDKGSSDIPLFSDAYGREFKIVAGNLTSDERKLWGEPMINSSMRWAPGAAASVLPAWEVIPGNNDHDQICIKIHNNPRCFAARSICNTIVDSKVNFVSKSGDGSDNIITKPGVKSDPGKPTLNSGI